MVSGVECAGLLLGTLPLFIEAGKAYADGVDTLLDVVDGSRRDEALEDFYDEFHEQIVEINEHVKVIYNRISKTIVGDALPTPTKFLSDWKGDSAINKAMRDYFGSKDRFDRFTRISSKIVRLLGELIKDKTTKLSLQDQDATQIFRRLEAFASQRNSQSTTSSLLERIRFFKKKKDRGRFLKGLKECTKSLGKLISRVERQSCDAQPDSSERTNVANPRRSPFMDQSLKYRDRLVSLHNAMKQHWRCGCKNGHELKFRLKGGTETGNETAVVLDCLIFADAHSTGSCWWQEARFWTKTHRGVDISEWRSLDNICELLQPHFTKFSLSLLLEDTNGQVIKWQHPRMPRQIQLHESQKPASLQDLLDGPNKIRRKQKLELALTLAYSLLLYHDSAWLSQGWNKKDMFFFYREKDKPDYESPYLSACFSRNDADQGGRNNAPQSPHQDILALGIILVEIFEQKPIERWRNEEEKAAPHEFTDWCVAKRVVEAMDPTQSQKAAKACLDWMRNVVGHESLEQQETRNEWFRLVITPLEKDLASLEMPI